MTMRMNMLLAGCLLLSAALFGCEPAGGPGARLPAIPDNPILVESEFEPLFQASGRALRSHRFTIFRENPQMGEIVTEPLTGQQMWEVWRSDAAGLYNQLESSMHTILRSVEVRIWPARNDAGEQLAGLHFLEVRAYADRLSVPDRAFTAANQLPTSYRLDGGLVNELELEQEGANRPRRVFLRRDNLLEDWLMRDILRISGSRAVPPGPTGAAGGG